MPFPVTPNILSQLSEQQRTMYEQAKEKEHPHMDTLAVERTASKAMRHFRNMYGREPEYTSEFKIKGEFDDGTTYTRLVIVVPRDEPLRD